MIAEKAKGEGDEIRTRKYEVWREVNFLEWLELKEGNWESERNIAQKRKRGGEKEGKKMGKS